jgi:hypothetical protein
VPKAKAIVAGAYSNYDVTLGRDYRPYRNVCLLPYINQEALKDNPIKLLSLLYNRTQYTPEQWAPYDKFMLDKDWELGSFDTTYNANCIIMFGEKYGTLTPWERGAAHYWKIIGFPRGILILEAQQRLMGFLRVVLDTLLAGLVRNDAAVHSNSFAELLENWSQEIQ